MPADGSESENALLAISLSVEVPGVKDIAVGDTPGGVELLRRSIVGGVSSAAVRLVDGLLKRSLGIKENTGCTFIQVQLHSSSV